MEKILAALSILLIMAVFITLIKKDFWIFKILEYPRLQKLVIVCIATAAWIFYWPATNLFYQVIIALLFISIIYLLVKIWPYTGLYKIEMLKVAGNNKENELKIFAANVLQDNQEYERLLAQIEQMDPDIIFLLETNKAWEDNCSRLKRSYPYHLLEPLENTYGLLLYSRFQLENARVNYLVKNDVPSIEGLVVLPSGKKVQLWGLHPEPPVPGESLYATAKDKELMKVALLARDSALPCIVMGDLNDVAWSHTTELFRKTSRMLDPRRGRGFYNTFSSRHFFVRFPLDYIFCSKEFGLISMKKMPENGSDHFAMFIHLCLAEEMKQAHDAPDADAKEISEAKEIAAQPVDNVE